MKKIITLLVITFVTFSVSGQNNQTVSLTSQTKLNLQLYRGFVEVVESEGAEIKISQEIFDYDIFDKDGTKVIKKDEPSSKVKLNIETTKNEIFVFNNASRNIQSLKILVPKNIELSIIIQEYGLVTVNEANSATAIEIYEGQIVAKIKHTLLATIIREGSMEVTVLEKNDTQFLMLNSYDGNIKVNLPKNFSAKVNATTELGTLQNGLEVTMVEEEGNSFVQKEGSESQELKAKIFKGVMRNGKNRVSIKNVKGNIQLNKI